MLHHITICFRCYDQTKKQENKQEQDNVTDTVRRFRLAKHEPVQSIFEAVIDIY